MRFLADESCDFRVVRALRAAARMQADIVKCSAVIASSGIPKRD